MLGMFLNCIFNYSFAKTDEFILILTQYLVHIDDICITCLKYKKAHSLAILKVAVLLMAICLFAICLLFLLQKGEIWPDCFTRGKV